MNIYVITYWSDPAPFFDKFDTFTTLKARRKCTAQIGRLQFLEKKNQTAEATKVS